jgi:imidazole glycerol-phosphate synthase subunit HisH
VSNVTGIVNYGVAGNIFSVKKTIERAGGKTLIIDQPNDFKKVDRIVLPGVGSFVSGMNELINNGFVEPIVSFEKPILGICLGMQLFSNMGFEYGETKGLGLIDAEVRIINTNEVLPHVGFNKIDLIRENTLLKGISKNDFYFMHSYEVVNFDNAISSSIYGNYKFISSIEQDNIFGVQFHPEKSREPGIQLFRNFISL